MTIFFDTETTGLRPGQIAQLSYVIKSGGRIKAKNFFFAVEQMEYSAFLVHGFSKEKLFALSNGKTFGDYIDEIEQDFCSADLVCAHNTSFDFMFMRAEFERLGKVFSVKNEFCSMKKLTPVCKLLRSSGGYKYPKLEQACSHFGITSEKIKEQSKLLFGAEAGFHDARFDTTALYLLMNSAVKEVDGFKHLEEFL
jgi:DNA polymerase-3 subunit epsilon